MMASDVDVDTPTSSKPFSVSPYDSMPSYLVAVDNHNIASGEWTIADAVKGTVGAIGGAIAGGVVGTAALPIPVVGTLAGGIAGALVGSKAVMSDGKFVATSILSGANSFYNTGIDVSNWFSSSQKQRRETEDWIGTFDSNLGLYYSENKESSDIAGFFVGSLFPTVGALKIYNAGAAVLNASKNGVIGANFSAATGLLGPTQARFLQTATAEIAAGDSAYAITNASMLKAFAVGAAEETIQGAVASVAVLSTMKASPILDAMDMKDMSWNVLEGALFGGVLGGVIRGAGSVGAVKKGVQKLDEVSRKHFYGPELEEGAPIENKFINSEDNRRSIPKPLETNPDGTVNENFKYQFRKWEEAMRKHSDEARIRAVEMAKGDSAIGQLFADNAAFMSSAEDVAFHVVGVKGLSRVTQTTAIETSIAKILSKGPPTPEQARFINNHNVSYAENYGENAGLVSENAPAFIPLADRLKPGQKIVVEPNRVLIGDKSVPFNVNAKARWNPLEESIDSSVARNIWAAHPDGPTMRTDMSIHDSDLALMKRMYDSPITQFKLIRADKSEVMITTKSDLEYEMKKTFGHLRDEFTLATEVKNKFSNPADVERRLKELLGIHFSLSKPGDPGHDPTAYAWTFRGGGDIVQPVKLNVSHIGDRRLSDHAFSIKHEQGHNQWNLASSMLATGSDKITDPALYAQVMVISKKMRPGHWKGNVLKNYSERDKVHEMMADTFAYYGLHPKELEIDLKAQTPFTKLYGNFVVPISKEAQAVLFGKARKFSTTELAAVLDTTVGKLEGTAVNADSPISDFFAMKTAAEEYTARMVAAGRWTPEKGVIPVYTEPRYSKIVTDTTPVSDLDGNVLSGLAIIKQQQRLQQVAINNAVMNATGPEIFGQLQDFEAREMFNAMKSGPGQSLVTSADQNYGSVGSAFQYIGLVTGKLKKAYNERTTATLNSPLTAMKMEENVALRWEALQTMLRRTPEHYVWDAENSQLILRRVRAVEQAAADGVRINPPNVRDAKAPTHIPVEDPHVVAMIEAHMIRNAERLHANKGLNTVNGYQNRMDPEVFYPIPPNLRDYPHFAFVVDDKLVGSGHVSMIYASDAKELEGLITKVRSMPERLTVITKAESERFHKATGDFQRDEVISENNINSALYRSGVSSNFVPKTDSKLISDSILKWHIEKDNQLARYAVSTKYSKEFAELKSLGEGAVNVATSKVGASSLSKFIETKVDNRFVEYNKTALDIISSDQTPLWTAFNNFTDTMFSRGWNKVRNLWQDPNKNIAADNVNKVFEEMGLKTAYYDAALVAHSNHTASSGALQTFVTRANAILATTLLRMDPMNAYNNFVGSPILTGGSMKGFLDAIAKGDPAIAGKLAYINLPGTSDSILSPTKLYATAIQNYFNKDRIAWATKNGFMSRHLMEHQAILDELALAGRENTGDLNSKLASAYNRMMKVGDIAEKVTGNKAAEGFNRFVASDIMRQVTDVAVAQGLITEKQSLSYINTFVNRSQGNYIASQRPLMFQGPIGSALGLFQTYQFNMAQQLLRHVGEGATKTAALTMGLQGTIYGLHGLPGFDYINAHIVGTMSGNTSNRDLYDATYGVAGKNAGDWLMYGAASNVFGMISPDLKANIYSRGDINPRNATIIPTGIMQIPIVGASAKFYSSMKEGVQKLAAGGDVWPTMLGAIEHSGINRPLTGLAQTLEGFGNPSKQSFSTTGKGNVIATNDMYSLANLTRILGARPFDEAITLDAGYRMDVYKSKEIVQRKLLGEAIKTATLGGREVSEDEMNTFADNYVHSGGKQEGFNKFFVDILKNSSTNRANQIAQNLKNPHSQSMQKLLGGYELKDFSN